MPAPETVGKVSTVVVVALLPLLLTGVLVLGFGSSGAEPPFTEVGADGEDLYRRACASCHGAGGEGVVGPSMAGIAERYPDIDDHVDVIVNGLGEMPAFGAVLSDDEVLAVVEFQRQVLDG